MTDDNALREVVQQLLLNNFGPDHSSRLTSPQDFYVAEQIIDAIRYRHAIVELPEPTSSGPVSTSWGLVTKWDRTRQTPGERRLVTIDPHDRGMTPESARALAAALLAAADAAEREK